MRREGSCFHRSGLLIVLCNQLQASGDLLGIASNLGIDLQILDGLFRLIPADKELRLLVTVFGVIRIERAKRGLLRRPPRWFEDKLPAYNLG